MAARMEEVTHSTELGEEFKNLSGEQTISNVTFILSKRHTLENKREGRRKTGRWEEKYYEEQVKEREEGQMDG